MPDKLQPVLAIVIVPYLVARARAARGSDRPREAALLYEEAWRLRPGRTGLRIQAGHMRKEAGEFAEAEAHYLAALERLPNDAELALQLGHFYLVAGRRDEAAAQYRRATTLRPGWAEPLTGLAGLEAGGWLGRPAGEDPRVETPVDMATPAAAVAPPLLPTIVERLAPDLAPRDPAALIVVPTDSIELRRLGRPEAGPCGVRRTLRGVEAIHGFCVSAVPITQVRIIVNAMTIHRCAPAGDHAMPFAPAGDPHRKYVFNIWLDFSQFATGLHKIELRFVRSDGGSRSFHDDIVIAPPLSEADYPASDGLVSISSGEDRSIEAQVRARPSVVRPAKRSLFPDGVRTILAMRTDQLGDLVASIPALTRLRELAPGARIVGLLTAANADLAVTLGLFDEVITVDFPDDAIERRRLMPLAAQEALRRRLAPYGFDIALDLAQAGVSRGLLRLAGAKFVYGVGGDDWPWLTAESGLNSHDRWNRMDVVPHSAKVLALVEALGAMLRTDAPLLRRPDLTRQMIEAHGIRANEGYAVLHMGARVAFSRWPHFAALTALLLRDSDLKIVLMTEDPGLRATMPAELLASDRVVYLDRRLAFDMFDAFISFATVVVGNDSGPKHLAALRGTNVVTLFTARINWAEWGQENIGSIISRKVPCQGCAIFHDEEDCGQGFTCIAGITPEEVLAETMRQVGKARATA